MLHVLPGVFQQSHCGPLLKCSSQFPSFFVDVLKAAAIHHEVTTNSIAGVSLLFTVTSTVGVVPVTSDSNTSRPNNVMVI